MTKREARSPVDTHDHGHASHCSMPQPMRLSPSKSDSPAAGRPPLYPWTRETNVVTGTIIDLFCGCGGLSYGFEMAGLHTVVGVDHDESALRTFSLNHPHARAVSLNLGKDDFVPTLQAIAPNPTVIVAGPPCQGFSLTGPRRLDDERNSLYRAALTAIRRLQPRAFVIENVPGLKTLYGGAIKEEILSQLGASGYDVRCEVLNAADYGVPQVRKRLFFVGVEKCSGRALLPAAMLFPHEFVTCAEAISDLPSLQENYGTERAQYELGPLTPYQARMRNGATELFNHVASRHAPHVKEVISKVPDGGNYKDLAPGVGTSRKFNVAWTRYASGRPSKTIDTGHRNHFHYKWDRVPTVRENARLQSFPDTFEFVGTLTSQHRQVGNAVPPVLAHAIARQILSTLNVEPRSTARAA